MFASFALDIKHSLIFVLGTKAAFAAFHIKYRIYDIASIMLTSCMLDIDHSCYLVLGAIAALATFHIK